MTSLARIQIDLPDRFSFSTTITIYDQHINYRNHLEAALNQLRAGGCPVKDEDVAHLSRLLHEHVSMLGRYSFSRTGGSGQRRVASPA